MYRKIEDFLQDWKASAGGTLKVIQAIPDEKKNFAIVEGHNTLQWLAWHLVNTAGAFGQFAKLQIPSPGPDMEMPQSMQEIANYYEQVMEAYEREVPSLSDEQLLEEIPAFGGTMPLGKLLRMVVDHQTHHRGQMTVLLRQAGLTVPPVMGPTVEMV